VKGAEYFFSQFRKCEHFLHARTGWEKARMFAALDAPRQITCAQKKKKKYEEIIDSRIVYTRN